MFVMVLGSSDAAAEVDTDAVVQIETALYSALMPAAQGSPGAGCQARINRLKFPRPAAGGGGI
jgi:hypothetical protein